MSYNNKSIKELHELLVNKEISALELTKATLSDISAREPQIDAFLKITEENYYLKQILMYSYLKHG